MALPVAVCVYWKDTEFPKNTGLNLFQFFKIILYCIRDIEGEKEPSDLDLLALCPTYGHNTAKDKISSQK